MKGTLILLGIAVLLTTSVYFFEEKAEVSKRETKEQQTMLFNPSELGELKAFSGNNFSIIVEGKSFFTVSPKKLVDQRNVDAFFNELSGLRVSRILSKEELAKVPYESMFASDSDKEVLLFKFSNKELTFKLGKKLEFDQSFYMEVDDGLEKKIVIAFDNRPADEIYMQNQAHRSDMRYKKFKSLIELDQNFFYDARLIKREQLLFLDNLDSIEIKSFRNKAYSLSILQNTSIPSPPNGVGLDIESFNHNFQDIMSLTAAKVVIDQKLEGELKSEIILKGANKQLSLKLYWEPKSKQYFAKIDNEEDIYIMQADHVTPFFRPVQDYWKMSLDWPDDNVVELIFDKVQMQIELPEKIEEHCRLIKPTSNRVLRQQACTQLNFFLRQRAITVAVDSPEVSSVEWGFDILINGRKYSVGTSSGEGLIWDREKNLLYTFVKPIPMREKDYLL